MTTTGSKTANPILRRAPQNASTSRDALWVSGARLVSQLCGLAALLIAARILSPAEVGVFAMLSVTVLLQSKIAEAGWSEYIIAFRRDRALPGTLFYCALASGAGFTLVSLAGMVAWLFWWGPQHSSVLCLFLLIVTIIPGSIITCQNGVLIREQRLRDLALYQAVSEACGLVMTITGLLLGWELVALAAGRCCTVLVALLMSIRIARWTPHWEFEKEQARDAAHYSASLLLSRVIQFVQSYSADFLIVLFVGITEVGVFRIASRIVGAVTELISEPVRMLAWSYLSRSRALSTWPQSFGPMVGQMLTATAFAALPVFAGLAAVSHELVLALLGDAWTEAGDVIVWLAIARGVAVILMFNEPALSIAGHIIWLPRLNMVLTVISLATLGFAAWIAPGLHFLAVSQTVAALLSTAVSLYVLHRVAPFSPTMLMQRILPAACATIIMVFAVSLLLKALGSFNLPALAELLPAVTVGAGAYVATAWYSSRALLGDLSRMANPG